MAELARQQSISETFKIRRALSSAGITSGGYVMGMNATPSPTCRKIMKENGRKLTFCGKKSIAGKSYCDKHAWTIYQKGTNQYRRRK